MTVSAGSGAGDRILALMTNVPRDYLLPIATAFGVSVLILALVSVRSSLRLSGPCAAMATAALAVASSDFATFCVLSAQPYRADSILSRPGAYACL